MADLKISQLDPLGLTESVDVDNDIFPIAKNFGTEGNRQYTLLDLWLALQNYDVNPFPQYALQEDLDLLVGRVTDLENAVNFPEVITYTTNRNSITSDVGKYIRYDSPTDVTYYIDQEGTVWPFGGEIHIEQVGAGKVTVSVTSVADGTVVYESIFIPNTRGSRAVISIKKTVHGATRADDFFTLFGGLEAV